MAQNPVVLVHGYSDQGASFRPWADQLAAGGYAAQGTALLPEVKARRPRKVCGRGSWT